MSIIRTLRKSARRRAGMMISGIALVLLALHLLFPAVQIDAMSMVLLVLALIPWLAPLVKSVEAPGLKIEMREMEELEADVAEVTLHQQQQQQVFMRRASDRHDASVDYDRLQLKREVSGARRRATFPKRAVPQQMELREVYEDAGGGGPETGSAAQTPPPSAAPLPHDGVADDPRLAMAQVHSEIHVALDRLAQMLGFGSERLPALPLVRSLEEHGALTAESAQALRRTLRILERASRPDAEVDMSAIESVRRVRAHLMRWLDPTAVAERVAQAKAEAAFS